MTTERKSPRFKTGSWAGRTHYECLCCPFDTLDHGKMIRHVRQAHPRAWEGPDVVEEDTSPLAGVLFGSPSAQELAVELKLTAKHFRGRTPSGKKGFTVGDVRAASTNQEG